MEITEVKVRLVEDRTERLKAFGTVTLDREFVVRDIKIIDGTKGLFVAMPSRKVTDHCPKCHSKNHLRAKYCNECGAHLPGQRTPDLGEGSSKLHVDVAHPINSECRNRLQKVILAAYESECERAKRPGYVPHAHETDEAAPAASAAAPEPHEPGEAAPTEEPPETPSEPKEKASFGEGLL